MMHVSGTFHYVATLPELSTSAAFDCPTSQRDQASGWPDDDGTRLVGPSPRLVVYDAGFNERTGPDRPLVLRHGLRLEASGRRRASIRAAVLHVEATLLPSLRAGDELHLVRTVRAELAISVLRDGVLVCAIGDVTAVPLGADLEARVPQELRERFARVFLDVDPEFPDVQGFGNAVPLPLAVRHAGTQVLVHRMRRTLGPYEIDVLRQSQDGLPGNAALATILRPGACSTLGVRLSAMLLAQDDALEILRW